MVGPFVLNLPYPPLLNHAYVPNGRGGKVFSRESKAWHKKVQFQITRLPCVGGQVVLHIREYRAKDSGDIDAPIKLLLDAMNGWAFLDDKQVKRMLIEQLENDPKNPRVVVQIVGEFIVGQDVAQAARIKKLATRQKTRATRRRNDDKRASADWRAKATPALFR